MALNFVPIRKVSTSEGITKSQNKTKVKDVLSLQNLFVSPLSLIRSQSKFRPPLWRSRWGLVGKCNMSIAICYYFIIRKEGLIKAMTGFDFLGVIRTSKFGRLVLQWWVQFKPKIVVNLIGDFYKCEVAVKNRSNNRNRGKSYRELHKLNLVMS